MVAELEVGFHAFSQLRTDLVVEIVGDLSPNLQTADLDYRHVFSLGSALIIATVVG
jgi:hypothetical protein